MHLWTASACSTHHCRAWYVPVKDLAAIYKEFYGREIITESTITDCTYLLFLELHGERLAVAKLFPTYASKSPFLVEKFHEYFLGGVDDMVFWTNNIFELTSHMLENGTRAMVSADLNQDGYEDLVVGAPGYSTLGHVQIGRVYVVYGNQSGLPPEDMDLDGKADQVLQGHQPSGRFGSALAVLDFNEDGVPDLAIGAPSVGSQFLTYKGAVYVYFGMEGRGLASQPNVTITCQYSYCNLGWSLLAADVDGDGSADLVVGSPYAPGGGQQRGFVVAFYSYFNRSDQDSLSRISFISSVLHQAGLALVYDLTDSAKPSLLSTFSGDRSISRFGGDIYLSDLDNDGLDEMIVTSPLRTSSITTILFGGAAGRVYVYNGKQTSLGNVTDHCKSWISPCPEDWAQYVLISPEKEVVVAAERSSAKARLGGRVFVYSL
ncbi:phosphatidylinositol-glycan-specific phospholipase D [Grus japonensis]|uniref:Phosphatidylinositol-glycan-specific phospholipase D n=1 Tax=Grus japonensis TaxID=30415 RepID=A0ABC9WFG9_GRUJA